VHNISRVADKELAAYFGSPVAYLFIGAFLAACLFVFFWVEAFFARNIADMRPLFDWMPVLLIVLAAPLTMRLWSEERRANTLEVLATLPVPTWQLVVGKFLAALALVALALAMTLPLPISVALIGPLDWGPVLGAYLATLLLAAAYLAIGLFVSARTDNPIVALIGTTLLCAVFYLIGSTALQTMIGHGNGDLLRLLGSGARFESITRGVIDVRDLYFYLSVVGLFLVLTIDGLERLRWAADSSHRADHHRWTLVTLLAAANLLAANLWLQSVHHLRSDLTAGHLYTLSDATRTYLDQLEEPLLIRAYFSSDTHPMLAPLVPQMRDLLREYRVAGRGRVRVEVVDPQQSPEREREAAEQYGIRPVAFQVADRYQSSVVNSYFDLLIKYGDQFETLNFRDLIEVKTRGETDLEVRLRNPEYDLTRAIKKVVYGYRGGGDLFAGFSDNQPVRLRGFISAETALPDPLSGLRLELEAVLDDLVAASGGRFTWDIADPDQDPSLADEIAERFGFQPLVLDLADPEPFYFYMVLEHGDQVVSVPVPEGLDTAGLERAISAGIRRFAPGMLRTIALYSPETAILMEDDLEPATGPGYTLLKESLRESFVLHETDLTSGHVPEDADLLVVVGPRDLDARQQFAIDQFLMQGGTVVIAATALDIDLGSGKITAQPHQTGLEDWLAQMGLGLGPGLVLDPRNTPFPIPIRRSVGGFIIEEVKTLPYPYFADVRQDGLAANSDITASLGQITMNWASPILVDRDRLGGRRVTPLIKSSPASWTSLSSDVQPDFDAYPDLGFPRGDDTGRKLLAVLMEGQFQSAFAERPSPLLTAPDIAAELIADMEPDLDPYDQYEEGAVDPMDLEAATGPVLSAVVEHSPSSARLLLISSATFVSDAAISLATEATQTRYFKPLRLIENALDWSLEDRGLLTLRGRGHYSRLLAPVGREKRMLVEYLNYALALAGLGLVYWIHRVLRRRRERAALALLGG